MNCRLLAATVVLTAQVFCANAFAMTLTPGTVDTGAYGNRFNGISNETTGVDFQFQGQNTELTLTLTTFDIDFTGEVSVLVNQQNLGALNTTADRDFGITRITIPASVQRSGSNTLSFRQINSEYHWGITNLLLEAGSEPIQLSVGVTDRNSYGNFFNGNTIDSNVLAFSFQSNQEELTLQLTTFDIDFEGEVTVAVNQHNIGTLQSTSNDGLGSSTFVIPANVVESGSNLLTFAQINPSYHWGVTNLLLDNGDGTPSIPQLTIGLADSNQYGFAFNGVSDNRERADFEFQSQSETLTLDITAFDIDNASEVRVLLNGTEIGRLAVTGNNTTAMSAIPVLAEDQRPGTNTLSFVQSTPGSAWGITDVMLTLGCNYPLVQN